MSAEEVAAVVSDLRAARVLNAVPDDPILYEHALKMAQGGTVVDVTAIYQSLVDVPRQISFYEDHPCITPPWESALICYVNGHGNVVVMAATATEFHKPAPQWTEESRTGSNHEVDWERVQWRLDTFVWVGGESDAVGPARVPVPTAGPAHLWRIAIYDDGEPADINWVQLLGDHPGDEWDMGLTVMLESLNFCSCRNVVVVEPTRPRAERRRLDRLGVGVRTINLYPIGRSVRTTTRKVGTGVPLTSVRGHFVRYGPEYDRGLLFGKLAGRFWVPQHARGDGSLGVSEHDYKLIP